MTQAHKTPGALVVIKEEYLEDYKHYENLSQKIFEVVTSAPGYSLYIRNVFDHDEVIGIVEDAVKTYKPK